MALRGAALDSDRRSSLVVSSICFLCVFVFCVLYYIFFPSQCPKIVEFCFSNCLAGALAREKFRILLVLLAFFFELAVSARKALINKAVPGFCRASLAESANSKKNAHNNNPVGLMCFTKLAAKNVN